VGNGAAVVQAWRPARPHVPTGQPEAARLSGTAPLPAVALANRTLSPEVMDTSASRSSRSTATVASALGINSSGPARAHRPTVPDQADARHAALLGGYQTRGFDTRNGPL
jgi:hypothetical protein